MTAFYQMMTLIIHNDTDNYLYQVFGRKANFPFQLVCLFIEQRKDRMK